jgi:hypothetical protein
MLVTLLLVLVAMLVILLLVSTMALDSELRPKTKSVKRKEIGHEASDLRRRSHRESRAEQRRREQVGDSRSS